MSQWVGSVGRCVMRSPRSASAVRGGERTASEPSWAAMVASLNAQKQGRQRPAQGGRRVVAAASPATGMRFSKV
jgi:hypothetical protein